MGATAVVAARASLRVPLSSGKAQSQCAPEFAAPVPPYNAATSDLLNASALKECPVNNGKALLVQVLLRQYAPRALKPPLCAGTLISLQASRTH